MKFGSKVWYAKRIISDNADMPTFGTVSEITLKPNYFSVMPAVSRGYVQHLEFGEKIQDYWTVVAKAKAFNGIFDKGDRFWLDGENPTTTPLSAVETVYGNGSSATAEVVEVATQNAFIYIVLKRSQEQIKSV